MLRYMYIAFLFVLIRGSNSKKPSEETQELLLKLVADGKTSGSIETQVARGNTGVKFQCPVSDEKQAPPSVHALRPEDIDVVAAIGDSYTAGFGAGANFLGPNAFLEHRGLSFSAGGDASLESHVSIPNILKKFNADVYGFSAGIGDSVEKSKLNVAISGAITEDLLDMIDELIERIEDDPLVNMEEDWKLINIFIGGNDIFDACLKPRFTPEHYREMLTTAFNTLKAMVPRALVNVLAIPDVTEIQKMTGVVCDLVHMSVCPCLFVEDSRKKLHDLSIEYRNVVEELLSSGDFDTEDFALVYQPTPSTFYIPVDEDGNADSSHFAPDCLHLSQKGHALGAYYLWSNMLEPVNAKTTKWAPTMEEYLPCPSASYIYTNRNSVTTEVKTGSVSSNQYLSSSTGSSSDSKSKLGGDVIAAIVLLVGSLAFIAGYAIHYQMKKSSRRTYESL